jgi:hypothetical protein
VDHTSSGCVVVNDIQNPSNVGQFPLSTGEVNGQKVNGSVVEGKGCRAFDWNVVIVHCQILISVDIAYYVVTGNNL